MVLSRDRRLYSTRRLAAAARRLGHTVQVIDPLDVTMMLSSRRPEAFYRGKPFPKVDAVVPRIGASITFYGTAVVRQLEMMGVYVLNPADAILNSRDKLRALQLLSQHDIGIPPTGFARRAELARSLLSRVEGPPAIVKLLEGTQGAGVIKVDSRTSFNATIDAFHSVGQNMLVQKFLSDGSGSDLRVIVVGRAVVAAMRRTARTEDFRSNVHRGGSTQAVRPDTRTRRTAVHAARLLGLGFAGVDLIETPDGPLVIEVNSSPGLEGIEKATGVDLGEVVVHHVEAETARHRARRKAQTAAAKRRA
ncbi:MAG TPA: RimK family alpha-L-glutamate ligase, partial [Nitriliruptorales bacterium]|nr:RimK family alpha-L-glutamate ligase [Nitriliruptorales bacterium]